VTYIQSRSHAISHPPGRRSGNGTAMHSVRSSPGAVALWRLDGVIGISHQSETVASQSYHLSIFRWIAHSETLRCAFSIPAHYLKMGGTRSPLCPHTAVWFRNPQCNTVTPAHPAVANPAVSSRFPCPIASLLPPGPVGREFRIWWRSDPLIALLRPHRYERRARQIRFAMTPLTGSAC